MQKELIIVQMEKELTILLMDAQMQYYLGLLQIYVIIFGKILKRIIATEQKIILVMIRNVA